MILLVTIRVFNLNKLYALLLSVTFVVSLINCLMSMDDVVGQRNRFYYRYSFFFENDPTTSIFAYFWVHYVLERAVEYFFDDGSSESPTLKLSMGFVLSVSNRGCRWSRWGKDLESSPNLRSAAQQMLWRWLWERNLWMRDSWFETWNSNRRRLFD